MPFDPSLPAENAALQSIVLREQLQALFNLINDLSSVTATSVQSPPRRWMR
jgi:hypothetical protein